VSIDLGHELDIVTGLKRSECTNAKVDAIPRRRELWQDPEPSVSRYQTCEEVGVQLHELSNEGIERNLSVVSCTSGLSPPLRKHAPHRTDIKSIVSSCWLMPSGSSTELRINGKVVFKAAVLPPAKVSQL